MTDADWTLEHLKAKFDATRDAADKLDARVSTLRDALEDAEIEQKAAWLDHQRVDIRLHLHRRLLQSPKSTGEIR